MYYRVGMEKRLRKGDVGEAIFREWFEGKLGGLYGSRGYTLEQQGFNPGGFVKRDEKRGLKEESDPDFAIYSLKTKRPIVGISVNTQAKFYTAAEAMGKGCIKCPRARSCHNGNESNLWYNKYNLSDYAKFEQKFGIETCMVTLLVRVNSIVKWVEDLGYKDILHRYISDGGENLSVDEKTKLQDLKHYLRHDRRKMWERPLEIRWVFRSELEEITPTKPSIPTGKVPFWTTGGRVEKGPPRPVCCVNANLARSERDLIDYSEKLI